MNTDQSSEHGSGMDSDRAEECCYRYLKIGGSLVLVGFIFMLSAVLFRVGAGLFALGAAIMVGNIVWFLRVRKQQGINVTCPSCSKVYTVLPGSHRFVCDECEHEVPMPRVA